MLIIKPDGQKIETKAWIQSKLILLQDISVPIQIGDYLERTRINGITDRYVITAVDVYEDSPLQHIGEFLLLIISNIKNKGTKIRIWRNGV